jgi:WD40 repeat protein
MSGEYIQDFIGHSDSIVSLQFGDGILFSGSFDATIKVWDVGSAVNIRTINSKLLFLIN